MEVVILRGLPGSGKSTFSGNYFGNVEVCSADHFFEVNGEYRFDVSKIGDAHAACLRKFTSIVTAGVLSSWDPDLNFLIVDNTNLSAAECAPYVALAQAYGYLVKVVTIRTTLTDAELSERNVHGVPAATIARMRSTMEREVLPPWWQVETVG